MCGALEEFLSECLSRVKGLDLTVLRPLRRKLVNQYADVNRLVQLGNFTFLHKFSSSDPFSNLVLVR